MTMMPLRSIDTGNIAEERGWRYPITMRQARATRLLVGVLALGAAAGCSRKTETTVPQSWKNTSYQGSALHKILIIAVGKTHERRVLFEDSLVDSLGSEGVVAEASWKSLPKVDPLSAEELRNTILAGGFDGVLLTRLVEVDIRKKRGVDPLSGNPMYTVYRKHYDEAHAPGVFDPNADYRFETSLFAVDTDQLVWVGRSVTTKPTSINDGIDSLTRTVARTLKQEGLVASAKP